MTISDGSSDVFSSDLGWGKPFEGYRDCLLDSALELWNKGRMFGRMAKMLLVLSAVAPVGLVYAWVAFNEGNRSVALWLIGGCIFLVFCCVYLFNMAHSVLARFPRSEERRVGKECL